MAFRNVFDIPRRFYYRHDNTVTGLTWRHIKYSVNNSPAFFGRTISPRLGDESLGGVILEQGSKGDSSKADFIRFERGECGSIRDFSKETRRQIGLQHLT